MQKSMAKKYWKLMPKGSQNDDKMDAKIDVFSYFFNKGEIARNYCITIENVVLDI